MYVIKSSVYYVSDLDTGGLTSRQQEAARVSGDTADVINAARRSLLTVCPFASDFTLRAVKLTPRTGDPTDAA